MRHNSPDSFLATSISSLQLHQRISGIIRSLVTVVSYAHSSQVGPRPSRPSRIRLYYTFPGALEEEFYDEHLQACHGDHEPALHQTEIEDALLCALDCAKVSVLACSEVLLVARDGG